MEYHEDLSNRSDYIDCWIVDIRASYTSEHFVDKEFEYSSRTIMCEFFFRNSAFSR